MGRAELVIILCVVAVAAGAFALEGLDPGAVRIIAISACLGLIVLMAAGLVVRIRMKRRSRRAAPTDGRSTEGGSGAS